MMAVGTAMKPLDKAWLLVKVHNVFDACDLGSFIA